MERHRADRRKPALQVNCSCATKKNLESIQADEILLAFQQLSNNSNSAIFNSSNHRIPKLPKSLSTEMRAFDGKSEKFELFGDPFPTSLKIHNQLTEDNRINYYQSLMKGTALQTFENINNPTRDNLGKVLAAFRKKQVTPQSMATAKHNFQKNFFNPANQKSCDFLDQLQKSRKDSFGIASHAIIEQFFHAKKPSHLRK